MVQATLQKVRSKDGTKIACWKSGSGPALVLVHGMSNDHTRWPMVLGEFERHFTVYAMDRRGRGGSGDTQPYSLEREFEDIAAVVSSIKGPVHLLGHSYGALGVLGASLLVRNLATLVVYEPDLFVNDKGKLVGGVPEDEVGPEVADRIESLVQAGDRDEAVVTFLRDIVKLSAEDVEGLRTQPSWQVRLASAHTFLRELRAPDSYRFDYARFKKMRAPTLMLVGGDSPAWAKQAAEAVTAALPNGRVVIMPGQGHIAMHLAPDLFLREVIGFLKS